MFSTDHCICGGISILEGLRVGDGAIVAAGAVVTKDAPPYVVVGGGSSLYSFSISPQQINWFEEFKWWNKDVKWLKDHSSPFSNTDSFISAVE